MTLLCVEPPRDESGFGYYRRLSAMNALWSWRDLAGIANVARTRNALVNSPDHVAAMLGLEPAWTQRALASEQSCRKWRGSRRTRIDAICPTCLHEAPYIRQHWEHAFVTACAKHAVILLDHCDMCGEHLSQDRRRIEFCDCGRDLTVLAARPCNASQRWLATLVETGGRTTNGLGPVLLDVDLEKFFLLVRTLCLFADPKAPPPRRNSVSPKSVAETTELLRPLERLLSDWPKAFEGHVAARIVSGRQDARTLSSLLGTWYAHMKRACATGGLRPFLEAVVRVAARNFDGALGLDAAGNVVLELTGYQRVAQAAKDLGVGREALVKAAQAGLLMFRTSRFGTRGLVYEVPVAEVERIRRLRAEWISEADASAHLRVPLSVLRNMMSSQVIVAAPGWRSDVFKGGPIHRASLDELLVRLNAAVVKNAAPGDLTAWADLTSRRLGDKEAIQSVMKAAASGQLHPVQVAKSVGQLKFRRDAVMPYFGTPVLDAGMSVQQLAGATGWKWESISHWIEQGLLASTEISLRGQPCRVILPRQLLEFRQTYVPLADLARSLGTKASSLAGQLKTIEVVGSKTSQDGIKRGGLIRLADLGRLALLGDRVQMPLRRGAEQ